MELLQVGIIMWYCCIYVHAKGVFANATGQSKGLYYVQSGTVNLLATNFCVMSNYVWKRNVHTRRTDSSFCFEGHNQ